VQEQQLPGVAFFNTAHSYAQSAVTLQEHKTVATHGDLPIYFLFFHAIELYLKAYLLKHGLTLEQLRRREFGHDTKTLAETAAAHGLTLSPVAAAVIQHTADTDNVITSRYIRLGLHDQVSLADVFTACEDLHRVIGPAVYEGTGVRRIPVLREAGPSARSGSGYL
jgi:hypothetical protein